MGKPMTPRPINATLLLIIQILVKLRALTRILNRVGDTKDKNRGRRINTEEGEKRKEKGGF
jgi:hypothetical protein